MAAVTALFMMPTALVFPALLRIANTPPSSATLARARPVRRQSGGEQGLHKHIARGLQQPNRPVRHRDGESSDQEITPGERSEEHSEHHVFAGYLSRRVRWSMHLVVAWFGRNIACTKQDHSQTC